MARLPTPGGDNGNWGNILNEYLSQSHNPNGTLKNDSVGSSQLQDNAVTSGSIAPDAVTATEIADGTIQEAQLAAPVQVKLNQAAPTWSTLNGKPAIIAAGADQATARASIGADDVYLAKDHKTLGRRIFSGAMTTRDNSVARTFQVTMELACQDFIAVRLLVANHIQNISPITIVAAASSPGTSADRNNNSGTWKQFKVGNTAGRWPWRIPPAGNASQRYTFTATDWLSLPSTPRTDGGSRPLLSVRLYAGSTPQLPVYGYSTDDRTNWATRTDGRLWSARSIAGDGITNLSAFTTSTEESSSPIIGVEYLTNSGEVINVAVVGDSITDGRGTYKGDNFATLAAAELSSSATAVEISQLGWAGQIAGIYYQRALDLLDSDHCPDVLVFPSASPNDETVTLTEDVMAEFARQRLEVLAACSENQVVPVIWTMLPVNTSIRPYGATDSLRTGDNTVVLNSSGKLLVADTASVFSGVTSGGQVQIANGLSSDNIHPNDNGNTALKEVIKPVIAQALTAVRTRRPRRTQAFIDIPIYVLLSTVATITRPGIYTYASSSDAAWTLAASSTINYAPYQGLPVFEIKLRRTAGQLTLTAGTSIKFWDDIAGASSNTLTLHGGQSVLLVNDGNYWMPFYGPRNHVGMSLPLVGVTGSTSPSAWPGVNRGIYVRIDRGGPVAKIRLEVGVSSGNVSVAAYRNTGSGVTAIPTGGPLASSGTVACPASGIADVSLSSTAHLNDGDWLFLSCDNTTATFRAVTISTQGLFSGVGLYCRQDNAHPAPVVGTLAATSAIPILIGLP